jgi:hypothetical protein
MSTSEVDRLERYLDQRFTTIEDRVAQIEKRIGGIEQDMATLRAFSKLVSGIATALAVAGVIAGISYLAR